jgi:hypothetical protein
MLLALYIYSVRSGSKFQKKKEFKEQKAESEKNQDTINKSEQLMINHQGTKTTTIAQTSSFIILVYNVNSSSRLAPEMQREARYTCGINQSRTRPSPARRQWSCRSRPMEL